MAHSCPAHFIVHSCNRVLPTLFVILFPCSVPRSTDPPIIGFCFSFALKQTALDRGILLDWTKVKPGRWCIYKMYKMYMYL